MVIQKHIGGILSVWTSIIWAMFVPVRQ